MEAASGPPLADLFRRAWQSRDGRVALIGGLGSIGLLGLLYAPELRQLVTTWSTDENYSHGFLVPLLSLYFANEAARRGPVGVRSGVGLGIGLLFLSVLGRLATQIVPIGLVGDLSFLLGLTGLVALLAGSSAVRRFGFALGFLVFMVPLPVALYSAIASPLQLIVSRIASGALNAANIPVLCEGNVLTLPGGLRMFVAEACSGMRQLTGFLALTTAVAYLSGRGPWYRAIVIAASFPIAMTANVVRVILTGVIMYRVDPSYASGTFHTLEGLLMMGFGLALLGAFCAALNQIIPTPGASDSSPARPAGVPSRPESVLAGA